MVRPIQFGALSCRRSDSTSAESALEGEFKGNDTGVEAPWHRYFPIPSSPSSAAPVSSAAMSSGRLPAAVIAFASPAGGVLYSRGAQSFDAVHVFGAEASAKAAKAARARVFFQMSALGANPESASAYARSKAEGEARAKAAFPGAAIIRPSIIFGPEDEFFNRFAALARFSPVLPLIGGSTRFQPVFVGDVAEAFAKIVEHPDLAGKAYELGGPEIMSFREILEYTLAVVERRRLLLPIPWRLARVMAAVMGVLPKPILTVELLKSDNVVGADAERARATLEDLGISPTGIEAIVPAYLYRFRKAGQFTQPSGV